jgi:glutathione S-transferase
MKSRITRRQFVSGSVATAAVAALPGWSAAEGPSGACTLENRYLKYVVGPDARSVQFVDKQTGRDYCGADGKAPLAQVKKAGRYYQATSMRLVDGRLSLSFADSGVQAVLKPIVHPQHVVLEVVSVVGDGIEELVLVDIGLALRGTADEAFAACALALDLRTNVAEIPHPSSRLRVACYPRFGMVGAKAALVAAPQDKLREALQEAVSAAADLPHSPLGGPWAMNQRINRGSYLFNFGGMTVEKADAWIKLVKSLGMNQIDFHGGGSFRFGDCRPNPQTYPDGLKSFKAVIDKLHAAGISAGLHTYAFFLDKSCPWVAPKPDARLASDATFTLAADLAPGSPSVPVVESTAAMSAITGFAVRNSVTLRIDDELITYTGVAKQSPFVFAGCGRGACGTRASAHAKGAKVHHLKECFGLFVPDPQTTLFDEIAAHTAEMFNACGFDMMYLDALDGEDILAGGENSWHYGSRFVYEIWKRLKKPALMEMSTFHHHLWCVRSRFCAWDHPSRAYKKFIDIHSASNDESRRMFLPGEYGWWALKNWSGPQGEPTFSDDIEYLMTKGLATDTGFALMGIDPDNVDKVPALPRLARIIRRYEELRHSGKVPESIKARLRLPGDEFTLSGSLGEGWQFRPVQYARHKVESAEAWSRRWRLTNRFAAQRLRVRIEALMAAGPYDAPGNPTLADFAAAGFPQRASAPGVAADLKPSMELVKVGTASGRFTATNSSPRRPGSWTKLEKQFSPPRNLDDHQALGLWVHGDGQGETLNVQLRSPQHLSGGIGDHYIVVDFTGWRYVELIEPEGDRYSNYQWPYGDIYSIYREGVVFGQVETLSLWYNHLPPDKPVSCSLSPIKALPLVAAKLVNPSMSIGGRTITFPVEIPSGHYLEFRAADDCKLFGPQGELVRDVQPQGAIPVLQPGENEVRFDTQALPGVNPRANVTLITEGEATG